MCDATSLRDAGSLDASSSVLVMLCQHDGHDDVVDVARNDPSLFGRLCELAQVHRQPDCSRLLDEHFPDWKRRYAKWRAHSIALIPPRCEADESLDEVTE